MAEDELSKRIDDVHRRLDDLRADGLQLRQDMASGFTQLRQEMKEGDAALRKETDRRSGQIFWQMNIWFAILALLMTAYRFLQ